MTTDATTTQVLGGLDHSVRPQDDLFRHVNGAWLESAEIPADQSSTGSFIDLRNAAEEDVHAIVEEIQARIAAGEEVTASEQKIADAYASFMAVGQINARGAVGLQVDFDLIDAADTKDELSAVLGRLMATGVSGPFGMEVDRDQNAPDHYISYLYQSGIGLPDEAFYRSPDYAEILTAYEKFIPVLYALGTGVGEEANAAAETILSIEKAIASKHISVVEFRDSEKTNNVLGFQEFIDSAPGFDWAAAFRGIGLTAENAEKLLIMTPETLTGVATVWQEFDLDDLKIYLKWMTILARAPFLSDEISDANFNFYGTVLSGQEVQRDRWKRGVAFVNAVLGEAVGEVYVAKHFPPGHKAKMEQLVADLLAAYQESIENLDWMSAETKPKALDKLSGFVTKIGYPERWRDYSSLEISPDDVVANVRASAEFETKRAAAKLGQPIDRTEWYMTPQTVNAYYSPVSNEIVFPAAILQPPFFDAEADPAWNYGGIGAVIGHEIGHGFDDQGSKYDGTGLFNNWWTDEDRKEFEARTAKLVEQYDAYVPAQFPDGSPHHVQGELTLGENIGDLGGLTIALKAYNIACKRAGLASSADAPEVEGLSGIKRVLLSYARIWQEKRRDEVMLQRIATDPHSPAEFRANGVVKNVDAFYEEFDVREGDELYLAPEDRVTIW